MEAWLDQPPGSSAVEVRDRYLTRFLEVCDNCGGLVCGTYQSQTGETHLWPTVVHRKDYPDVPEAIAAAASEAHQALGALAPRAAVAMARAVIEAIAKEKKIVRGSIHSKIEELAADGHISHAMKEAAHEIRLVANEAVHSDLVDEPIDVDEGREVVELMDAILERVYQEPAKVERVRASRMARQKRPETLEAAG